MAFSDEALATEVFRRSFDINRVVDVALLWHLAILLFWGSTFSSSCSRRRFVPTDMSFSEEFDEEYAMVDIERSTRRGGENRARLDFSTRSNTSGGNFGNFTSSLAGLRNNARFEVSRVAVVDNGIMSAIFCATFFDEPGVLRPGVRRPAMLNVRRFGVAGLTFFINFLKVREKLIFDNVKSFDDCKTYEASIMHGFRPKFNVLGIRTCDLKLADENAALLLAKWLNRLPGDAALQRKLQKLHFHSEANNNNLCFRQIYIFRAGFLTAFVDASNVNELLVSWLMCRSANFIYMISILSLCLVRL